jgi:hypothetical protein
MIQVTKYRSAILQVDAIDSMPWPIVSMEVALIRSAIGPFMSIYHPTESDNHVVNRSDRQRLYKWKTIGGRPVTTDVIHQNRASTANRDKECDERFTQGTYCASDSDSGFGRKYGASSTAG